mgnify:CR=1 FL=1
MFEKVINHIQDTFGHDTYIPLHEPKFVGNEKKYLLECVDSTYVSSIGFFVDKLEKSIAEFVGSKYAVATTNGTSALHIALLMANVERNDEVITQPLTFVATCNAISYCGARPIFIDVDKDTMGLSPFALEDYLKKNAIIENNQCINQNTGNVIRACIPMHTFGNPCRIDLIKSICDKYNLTLIEDAAESLGSEFKKKSTGTFGKMGVFSFNGNKIVTAGGGGCIVTDDEHIAKEAKHLTTTAKIPHKWKFDHDNLAFNYRMPNINASLLLAQFENLKLFIDRKRKLADAYEVFFNKVNLKFVKEIENAKSNYWLNSIILDNVKQRDDFLEESNANGVMTRPLWTSMNNLSMYKDSECGLLTNSEWLEQRVVTIPSSVIL